MSVTQSRHKLMQALVRGSNTYGANPSLNYVDAELEELGRCARLQPIKRQRLLQVIHASRALDTCLSTVIASNGIAPQHGIGKMLNQLKALPPNASGYMSHAAASNFISTIAHKRNRYAHQAGAFPSSTKEVDDLVSEVHACLATIL
jgi:hypothetical protein